MKIDIRTTKMYRTRMLKISKLIKSQDTSNKKHDDKTNAAEERIHDYATIMFYHKIFSNKLCSGDIKITTGQNIYFMSVKHVYVNKQNAYSVRTFILFIYMINYITTRW